ncbi:MAG: hypothetical protein ABFC96_06635 [Thermoguttaceae bacterium]
MSVKYLLPCRCGQQIPIEPRQAGEAVVCACGESLQAPTLREITALELAAEESTPAPASAVWSWRHGLRLLGIAMTAMALVWGVLLYTHPPISRLGDFNPDVVRRDIRGMSPSQTWQIWEMYKEGLDRRIDQRYARDVETHTGLKVIAAVMALLGVGLIGGSAVGRRRTTTHD